MEIYLIINNEQKGPFTLEQVAMMDNITPDTPVWYEGLAQWVPAGDAPRVREIFAQRVYTPLRDNVTVSASTATGTQTVSRPSNYIVGSILCALLMNTILGIIAIFFSFRVNYQINCGDIDGAARSSERAQLFICLSIVVGLVFDVISLMFIPLSMF